jgi:hypothetical protein
MGEAAAMIETISMELRLMLVATKEQDNDRICVEQTANSNATH